MADANQNSQNSTEKIKIGILTVSDSCYQKTAEDRSGPNLKHLIEKENVIPGVVVCSDIVPDEEKQIQFKLLDWCDQQKLELILTTGGTGFSPRDVTPEATKSIIEKEAPGLTIAMMQKSLNVTPLAALSRAICGSRGRTLIINLPGSKKGSQECLTFIAGVVPHAVDLLQDRKPRVASVHQALQGSEHCRDVVMEIEEVLEPSSIETRSTCTPEATAGPEAATGAIQDSSKEAVFIRPGGEIVPKSEAISAQPLAICEVFDSNSGENCSKLTYVFLEQDDRTNDSVTGGKTQKVPPHGDQTKESVSPRGKEFKVTVNRNEKNSVTSPRKKRKLTMNRDQTNNSTSTFGKKQKVTVTGDRASGVYTFQEESESEDLESNHEDIQGESELSQHLKYWSTGTDDNCEHALVNTGADLKHFLSRHPLVKNLYLNRQKRSVQKKWVRVKHLETAVDKARWHRGGKVDQRVRLDDCFEYEEAGRARVEHLRERGYYAKQARGTDIIVVDFSLFCGGRGNCLRRCGGYGKCIPGCPGKKNKVDRHNCSVFINLKIYLCDLTKWHVWISGAHVPPGVLWKPPVGQMQRVSEDMKDLMLLHMYDLNAAAIHQLIIKKFGTSPDEIPAPSRIAWIIRKLKKRRLEKDFNVGGENSESENDNVERNNVERLLQPENVAQSSSVEELQSEHVAQDGRVRASDIVAPLAQGNVGNVTRSCDSDITQSRNVIVAQNDNVIVAQCENVALGNNVIVAQRENVAQTSSVVVAQSNVALGNSAFVAKSENVAQGNSSLVAQSETVTIQGVESNTRTTQRDASQTQIQLVRSTEEVEESVSNIPAYDPAVDNQVVTMPTEQFMILADDNTKLIQCRGQGDQVIYAIIQDGT